MNNKHKKTLKSVFQNPLLSNIIWNDIESLFIGLGALVKEAEGSRISVSLNDKIAVFHRPHPRKETDKGALKSVRRFLVAAGVNDV